MRIIYPSLPYEPRTVDPLWQPEYEWACANEMNGELYDIETYKLFPRYGGLAKALYRGVASVEQWQKLRTKHELTDGERLFVRQFVELAPGSEQWFFVVAGVAYGARGTKLPQELLPVLSRLAPRPFYSLDVARTTAGAPIVVEVGDGQVSDLKEWPLPEFGDTVLRSLAAITQP